VPAPRSPRVALLLVLVLLTAGCTQVVVGRAGPGTGPRQVAAHPAVRAPDLAALPADEVAEGALGAVQGFWADAFPAAFGAAWTDVAGAVPVAVRDPAAPAPPCGARAADLAGKAFYCPGADAVVWDADGLMPDLHAGYGPAGVVVVLAHEVGHAVQHRLGLGRARDTHPDRYPTILLEAMADCYAGVVLRDLVEGPDPLLSLDDRDAALNALVRFRDPLGALAADADAHGNAFDRVSAFQDGYADGATRCAAMTVPERAFTQRGFGSAADLARRGDLPPARLLTAIEADARAWFATVVAAGGRPGWEAPPLVTVAASGCPAGELAPQGPVAHCPAEGTIAVDPEPVAALHGRFGDYATATLVLARYGLASLAALSRPVTGPAAGAAATCLAGAYSGRLLDPAGEFRLSPGDLDEAVQVLLDGDWTARDLTGTADPRQRGHERVARFRTGLRSGPQACLGPS
jgi:predicted metalloprotease